MKTPMKNKTKIITAFVAVIVLAATALAGYRGISQKLSREEYTKQIREAEKYLADGDTDKAILAYERAIKTAPDEAEAYEEIAKIYIDLNKPEQARHYLTLGKKQASNTGRLSYMLKNFDQYFSASEKETLTEPELYAEEEEVEEYRISGTVVDAVTGKGVADADIIAAVSKNNDSENAEGASAAAKANGGYEVRLKPGKYVFTVRCEGYVEESFDVTVSDKDIKGQNFTISPELATGEIRIVLEWGAQPRDLDAYLFADSLSDSNPVFFGSKGNEAKGAVLDIDDTNGYGPETITISDTSRTWIYGVQDFTSSGNGLANSEAVVKVYLPGQTPIVYTPPQGAGDYWTVCKISNGTVGNIGKIGESFLQ